MPGLMTIYCRLASRNPWLLYGLLPASHRSLSGSMMVNGGIKLDGTSDDVADIFDRHLVKKPLDRPAKPAQFTSAAREAIHLYRLIQRYTAMFDWPDDDGELWRDKLRRSARQEFEASKLETDPTTVARLLLTSREAVEQVMLRLLEKRRALEASGRLPPRIK
ncbi:MAG: LYR motif-containing protein [Gammaproteobacteria bacterium]|nr:LYR motif-containing protein [Gammaproteobacteria bacterium]